MRDLVIRPNSTILFPLCIMNKLKRRNEVLSCVLLHLFDIYSINTPTPDQCPYNINIKSTLLELTALITTEDYENLKIQTTRDKQNIEHIDLKREIFSISQSPGGPSSQLLNFLLFPQHSKRTMVSLELYKLFTGGWKLSNRLVLSFLSISLVFREGS